MATTNNHESEMKTSESSVPRKVASRMRIEEARKAMTPAVCKANGVEEKPRDVYRIKTVFGAVVYNAISGQIQHRGRAWDGGLHDFFIKAGQILGTEITYVEPADAPMAD